MTLGIFERQYTYPPGAVLMWSGSLATVPAGFLICDGSNGTPDMRNRFVEGPSSSTGSVGGTSGTNSFTLSSSQLRRHRHSFSTDSNGSHRHNLRRWNDRLYRWDTRDTFSRTGSSDWYSSTGGNHSHSISSTSSGGTSSIDNQPPYYTLAFIQKA